MVIESSESGLDWLTELPTRTCVLSTGQLSRIVAGLAVRPHLWRDLVRHDPLERRYQRLLLDRTVEVWLIGWWPGQHIAHHDHGGANGALVVIDGELVEEVHRPDLRSTSSAAHRRGSIVELGPSLIHQVSNQGDIPATSIHAYSPPGLPVRHHDVSLLLGGTAERSVEAVEGGR
jgi:predicted metal-dependent enzyme (double-stranded beta helix superfamily)